MKKVFDSVEDRAAGGTLDVNTQEIGALSCVMHIQELGGVLTIQNRLRPADALTSMYILGVHGGGGNGKQTVGFNVFADQIRFSFVIAASNLLRIIMFDEPITPFGNWVMASANPNIPGPGNTTPFTNFAIGAYRAISAHVGNVLGGRMELGIARAGLQPLYAQTTPQAGVVQPAEPVHVYPHGVTFTLVVFNIGGAPANYPCHVIGYF